MIIDFSQQNPKLHEWLYDIVVSICYDRDYAYKAFCDAFSELSGKFLSLGSVCPDGEVTVYGIKSEYNAIISYSFIHRLNYVGLNEITLKCDIVDKRTGGILETHIRNFELSLGQSTNQ